MIWLKMIIAGIITFLTRFLLVSLIKKNSLTNKTKIVLTGDPYQIDNPYLDASTNGLTYLVERMKNQSAVGHVTFAHSERSSLASLAIDLL